MHTDTVMSLTSKLQPGTRGALTQQLITSAMNDLYPKAGTAVDFEKQMEAIRQLAIYYGLSNVSEQLVLIAMNKQKGFDIRQVFASMAETAMDNWVGVAMHAPVPSLSQANLTTPEILMRVNLDLVETVVGDAIMGCPIDVESFMANELGAYVGGRMANPVADYLNAPQRVPVRSSQQIKQDSLSPQSADYLMASAAAKGQGFSPDFLGAYPGYDDSDDLLNYYLSLRSTTNQPAVQNASRAKVQQQVMQQQRQAAKAQGARVNYLGTLPGSDELDDLINPWSSRANFQDNAAHFAGSALNRPDPHFAPDVLSQLHDIERADLWAWRNGVNVLPAPNSAGRTTANAQVGWFRRDMNYLDSMVGFASYAMQHSGIDMNGMMVGPMLVSGVSKSINELGPIDPELANLDYISRGYFGPYDSNFRPRNINLANDRIFVRMHGPDNQISKWMMRSKEIESLTPLQIKEKFALEFMPTYMSEVNFSAGSGMRVSIAGPQAQWGTLGGGTQYELLQRIPELSFRPPVPIYQPLVEPNYFEESCENWSSIMMRK